LLNETFYLDGVDAETIGLKLQMPLYFSEPVPIVEKESIAGRNGDILYNTGSYENRTAKASCFSLNHDVRNSLRAINKFLLSSHEYRRLETSDDPDHFWMARVSNGARIEQRVRILAPFEIEFDCKPQMFVNAGEEKIEFTSKGILFNNYFYDAKPLIIVYGSGSGELTIGERTIKINSLDGPLYIDSETQNAYNRNGNQNKNIDVYPFPVLHDGENEVKFIGGIDKVEIIPRWWEL
jgi:predicted phage tail component-like protein